MQPRSLLHKVAAAPSQPQGTAPRDPALDPQVLLKHDEHRSRATVPEHTQAQTASHSQEGP